MSGLLAGKRIVVTGAARGLGRSFAAAVAQAGASVVMCDILAEELQDSAASLREQGAQVEAQVIDLASPQSITAAFSAIAKGGAIDGLVNNRRDGNRCRWQNHDGIRH
ncbi:Pyridoxal 4-dehydrogenase [Serratia fonticola]|uniref:Pyridoxal 4-dehydrogenase n=1 Tax=Serratia fonticola TaxID=47917 RepID=A0A4U9WEA7_SERFO|nr:Pyridoxal 4-dehydrogenase [Serratia fonticola]